MVVYQSLFLLEGFVASATWASPMLAGPHLLFYVSGDNNHAFISYTVIWGVVFRGTFHFLLGTWVLEVHTGV